MIARHPITDRHVLVIGDWNLEIIWNLTIVIWNFSTIPSKVNCLYLNQLVLIMTTPLASQGGYRF